MDNGMQFELMLARDYLDICFNTWSDIPQNTLAREFTIRRFGH